MGRFLALSNATTEIWLMAMDAPAKEQSKPITIAQGNLPSVINVEMAKSKVPKSAMMEIS